ncbi:hypothetical protein D3C84_619340 [compost metagenome]
MQLWRLGFCRHGERRRGFSQYRVTEVLDRVDQPVGRRQWLTGTRRVEHLCQAVMAALQQFEQRRGGLQRAGGQTFVEKLQLMGQIADRSDFHHARTALEGVQVAQQGFQFLAVRRLGLPAQQRRAGAFDDVEAFFKKDVQQLAVMVGRVVAGRRFEHLGVARVTLPEGANRFDQVLGIAQGLMVLQLLKQLGQAVMALLQQLRQRFAVAVTAIHQPFIKTFQFVGQITDRFDLGHPRAPLEGVQIALQRRQGCGILRIANPALQGMVGAFEDILGLLEENRHDVVVQAGSAAPCRSRLAGDGR